MLTETKRKKSYPFGDLEVEIYPDEFIRELKKEAAEAMEQFKLGELTSIEDFARELGIDFKK